MYNGKASNEPPRNEFRCFSVKHTTRYSEVFLFPQKGSIIYSGLIRTQQWNEIKIKFFHLTFTSLYPRIFFIWFLVFKKEEKLHSLYNYIIIQISKLMVKKLFRHVPKWNSTHYIQEYTSFIVLNACHGSIKPINPRSFSSTPTKHRKNIVPRKSLARTKLILFLDFTSNWTGSSNRVRKILDPGTKPTSRLDSKSHSYVDGS